MTMKVKLIKRVFSRWYGASILVILDMNKQECYTQLNHDYTSTQFGGFYAVNGQPTVPLCEYGIYI